MIARSSPLRPFAFGCALGLTFAGTARGQMRDAVAAEALFDEARQLMKEGRYAEACPKLESSQRLDPGLGTLLNLGDCLEKDGRSAGAWAAFREAASAAVAANQPEREAIARARAVALEPKLCRIVVQVEEDSPGLTITRDGVALDRALWREAIPVDPGPHVLGATAPSKRPWEATAPLEAATCAGTATRVVVPRLEAVQTAPALVPVSAAPVIGPRVTRWGPQRKGALASSAVAVASLAASAVLAAVAASTYAGAKSECVPGGCGAAAQARASRAGGEADAATVTLAAGGAALAVGGILWFTAPSRLAPALAGASAGWSLGIAGAF